MIALAADVELRAERHVLVVLTLDDRGHLGRASSR